MDSAPSSVIQEDSQGFSKTCRNQTQVSPEQVADGNAGKDAFTLLKGLSLLDRFLAIFVLLAMVAGVLIGYYVDGVADAFSGATFEGVSVLQYEKLPTLFRSREIYVQIGVSLVLNWIIGPFVMLGVAYATLPDLPDYRTGVIMVGLARCIAMVMIWNALAGGDNDYCAILVIINSILQIVLYSPYSLFFVNVVGNLSQANALELDYGPVAIAVLIYLGIPLAAGVVTRFTMILSFGRPFFENKFLKYFSPLALIGLLYTIIVIFAEQAHQIIDNIGPVFRVFVPMILYFAVMWTGAFGAVYWWNQKRGGRGFGYEMAVVQAFTAGSNNFELSIAVCVAVYGVQSPQALAATIGPLVEVPVLLALTWVALYLRGRLAWKGDERTLVTPGPNTPPNTVQDKGDASSGEAKLFHV